MEIKNGQSREIGNSKHIRHRTKTNKTKNTLPPVVCRKAHVLLCFVCMFTYIDVLLCFVCMFAYIVVLLCFVCMFTFFVLLVFCVCLFRHVYPRTVVSVI
jgi:hypothetical protein